MAGGAESSVLAAVATRHAGCYGCRMSLPFPLPDWLPWWLALAVLVPALLYLLVFLVMPFSVFGLKGRLDQLEAQLDDIQGELRRLGQRPPEPVRYAVGEAPPAFGRAGQSPARRPATPPDDVVDRAPPSLDAPPPLRSEPPTPARRRPPEDPPRRMEPRLDWPRS